MATFEYLPGFHKVLGVERSTGKVVVNDKLMEFPSSDAVIARTDAAQSFTGAQTFTDGVRLAPVVVSNATTYAVLAADSGKLHVVPDQTATITVTLPAAASGLTYEFMYGGAAADAQNHIFVPTAGFYIGGVVFHDQDGDVSSPVFSNGSSNDVFTVVTPDNYWLKFVSNGTNWYVNGYVHSATVCTMGD